MSTTTSMRPEKTSFPKVNPNATIISRSVWKGNEAISNRAYPGHRAITEQPQSYVWIKPQS
jgi:hypothetical protein